MAQVIIIIITIDEFHNCQYSYYRSSTEIQLTDFYSVKVLDRLYDTVGGVMDIINKTGYTGNLWLGETSSSYGGGRVLYSECFISGFMLV